MSKLLVSVRNVQEVDLVTGQHQVDVIDVKEPDRGALGFVENPRLCDILRRIPSTRWSSVAMGELNEWIAKWGSESVTNSNEYATSVLGKLSCPPPKFAKLGLSHVSSNGAGDWVFAWQSWASLLPKGTRPVGVAYADHEHCSAPSIVEVIRASAKLNCPFVLIDTFDKTLGSVFDLIPMGELRNHLSLIRALNMRSVLAGSVSVENLGSAFELCPDIIAVRGAVCAGARTSTITRRSLNEFVNVFQAEKKTRRIETM